MIGLRLNKPSERFVLLLIVGHLSLASVARSQALWPDFPDAAQTPSVTNHFNPQHNDAAPIDAPVGIRNLWKALPDYAHFNPCASGPEGNLYCPGFKEVGEQCGLVALDYKTGEKRWDDGDANGGNCLLDVFAFPTTPLVDHEGHVYAGDSQRIVSFTSEGELRWTQSYPADLTASSPSGRVNTPFGMNILPTGELVTGTLGDAFILIMDRETGELLAEPFDVPSQKIAGGDVQLRPPWANNKFACGDPSQNLPPCGDAGADAAWDSSFADTDNENDNDLSVDGRTGTIFMTGAAEAPNDFCEDDPSTPDVDEDDPTTPCGDGKLWALDYDPSKPYAERISVRFSVRFAGPGGSATTPGVSDDGLYAVISNNDQQALVADIPLCLAEFSSDGSAANGFNECPHFANVDLPNNLLASPTVTRDNILIVLGQQDGVIANQLTGRGSAITGTPIWAYGPEQMVPICAKSVLQPNETLLPFPLPLNCTEQTTSRTAVSVISAFNNVTYFGYTTLQILGVDAQLLRTAPRFPAFGPVTTTLVAVDTQTGEELAVNTFADGVGELANVTMAADGATLVINNFNFLSQVFWDRGLLGLNPNPVLPPGPSGQPLDFFKLLQPKPFDQAADGGISAWVPLRPELPVSGNRLTVVDGLFDRINWLSFQSRDPRIDLPAQGSALDPRRHGAEFVLFNPDSGEKQTLPLPADGWRYRASGRRYVYSDPDGDAGPCKRVVLRENRLNASCSGKELSFSLDEPTQGRLGVSFGISPARSLCALFGGDIFLDIGSQHFGLFSAMHADRSDECIVPE